MPGWAKNASMARLKSTMPVLVRQADSTYRPPLMSTAGFGALTAFDFAAVKLLGECQHRSRFAQSGEGVDGDRAFGLDDTPGRTLTEEISTDAT
jgi:hypothetical protein